MAQPMFESFSGPRQLLSFSRLWFGQAAIRPGTSLMPPRSEAATVPHMGAFRPAISFGGNLAFFGCAEAVFRPRRQLSICRLECPEIYLNSALPFQLSTNDVTDASMGNKTLCRPQEKPGLSTISKKKAFLFPAKKKYEKDMTIVTAGHSNVP